jgi:NAD-dependent dihydropyrimidine dehydrogenase PreA subunit
MKRKIIKIAPDQCTGCGLCIPNCPEGAIQILDGKARLVSDLMCDGLGACLGHCPEGAITLEEREAESYDERKVMRTIIPQGDATLKAHLEHLRDHGQDEFLRQALEVLAEDHIPNPLLSPAAREATRGHVQGGCPGARAMHFAAAAAAAPGAAAEGARPSRLTHWPVQLHLLSPQAPHYRGSDVLLAADCTAFVLGDFHKDYLKGRTLAIACPKLDEGQDVYLEKLKALIDEARIHTLTVMIMQVPCCGGLLRLAQAAAKAARREVPVKCVVVGIQGGILKEEWVSGGGTHEPSG